MNKTNPRGFEHIGVSAVAVVHNGEGKILMQKRGPQARDEHGRWDVTGGAIEFGDTIEETLERELMEELNVRPLDMQFLKVFDAHRKQNGRDTHWIAIVYTVLVDPESVHIGEPHKISEIGWFGASELPKPLHSQFPKVRQDIIDVGILR